VKEGEPLDQLLPSAARQARASRRHAAGRRARSQHPIFLSGTYGWYFSHAHGEISGIGGPCRRAPVRKVSGAFHRLEIGSELGNPRGCGNPAAPQGKPTASLVSRPSEASGLP
jgi:hypothetical protein